MRVVFEMNYELDEDENVLDSMRLITEDLAGWEGARGVRCMEWQPDKQQFRELVRADWQTSDDD